MLQRMVAEANPEVPRLYDFPDLQVEAGSGVAPDGSMRLKSDGSIRLKSADVDILFPSATASYESQCSAAKACCRRWAP